ncbi:hypothetical protein PG999_010301 [Apiospora kogelbergensis]|uniref:Uncharacterized protein n=1 Tax=Apiospora kogelbergensis TaxID=1337665 RepID=A0AAW0QHF8_9PEZI
MRFATLFALAIAAITTTALPSPSAEEPSDKPLPVPSDEPTAPPEQYRKGSRTEQSFMVIAIPSAAPWATSTPSALAIALGLKVMGVEWKRNGVYVKDCDVLEMITQPG